MIVIDTHVLTWVVEDSHRLGSRARETIAGAAATTGVQIPAIVPWEIALLADRGRLKLGREIGAWIESALAVPGFRLAPLLPVIAIESVRLPGRFHADPADRFMVATARVSGAAFVTADRAILQYGDEGHLSVIDATR